MKQKHEQDPDNQVVQDASGVWRIILNGQPCDERYASQDAAMAAWQEAMTMLN